MCGSGVSRLFLHSRGAAEGTNFWSNFVLPRKYIELSALDNSCARSSRSETSEESWDCDWFFFSFHKNATSPRRIYFSAQRKGLLRKFLFDKVISYTFMKISNSLFLRNNNIRENRSWKESRKTYSQERIRGWIGTEVCYVRKGSSRICAGWEWIHISNGNGNHFICSSLEFEFVLVWCTSVLTCFVTVLI